MLPLDCRAILAFYMFFVHIHEEKGEKNINIINIKMSQKYVEIANLFERNERGEKKEMF